MTKIDKTVIALIVSALSVCGVLAIENRRKYRIVVARLKRGETFRAEREAYKNKYSKEDLNSPEAIQEFFDIVNRYENR